MPDEWGKNKTYQFLNTVSQFILEILLVFGVSKGERSNLSREYKCVGFWTKKQLQLWIYININEREFSSTYLRRCDTPDVTANIYSTPLFNWTGM